MAYLAQLGALTDELIAVVAAVPEGQDRRRHATRESALRAFRHHKFGRTNQFEVDEHLGGLVERLRVTGREALGDALARRLQLLAPLKSRWTPEILHLLLELSDQPAEKTKIDSLHSLHEPEEDPGPALTWAEIAEEDGWDEDRALWRNVNFDDNSDDDVYEDVIAQSLSENSESTAPSSPDRGLERIKQAVSSEAGHLLQSVQDSQAWRHAPLARAEDGRTKKTFATGLSVVREVLFMLGGFETSLFDKTFNPVPDFQLHGISWTTHKALMTSFGGHGRDLAPLRRFSAGTQQIPLLQVFHASVQETLRRFDEWLAHLHCRFVSIKEDVVVSLMAVLTETKSRMQPLCFLSRIIEQLEEERSAYTFRYLELLYDAAGVAQLECKETAYLLLGTTFFHCFQVYLRPIRLWMEEGNLVPGDKTFFVAESEADVPLNQVWQRRFQLLRAPSGVLHAPKFLQPAVQRIFATGKSIVLLKHLGQHGTLRGYQKGTEPHMAFDAVSDDAIGLAPFSEAFAKAFELWIESKHHSASSTLRKLLTSCGLFSSLDALQTIFLMSDGAQSDAFASALFKHLDGLSSSWRDRFTLTEVAQEAYSSGADSFRLSARLQSAGLVHSAIAARSSVRFSLPAVQLIYRLSWPVQIVITEEGMRDYQAVFTFLLQIKRAFRMLLHRHAGVAESVDDDDIVDEDRLYYLIRAKLLWFCNSIMSYVALLVITPYAAVMREGLIHAVDVDEMIEVHARFTERLRQASCLGPKLKPIHDCILDMLDLTVKLEDAHRIEVTRRTEEDLEISRLSRFSTPNKTRLAGDQALGETPRRLAYDDDEEENMRVDMGKMVIDYGAGAGQSYSQTLTSLNADFERHLRFLAGGLRGVARASRVEAAAKWDLLAEMMEVGIKDRL